LSLAGILDDLAVSELMDISKGATRQDVTRVLGLTRPLNMQDLAVLLSPAAARRLEDLAGKSRMLTLRHFGRVMSMYAPLYLSNECAQDCLYCGFRAPNKIVRRTLATNEAIREAMFIRERGIRHLLLVSGEHPGVWDTEQLEDLIRELGPLFPSLSIEVKPLALADYLRLKRAGLDGLTLYQETYDRGLYDHVHKKGRKKNYDARLEAVEDGARAGLKRIGLGALLGLGNWKREVLALVAHVRYMERKYWRTFFAVSLPRMRYAQGAMNVPHALSDRDLAQVACALRIALPRTGLVLSTREPPGLRDGLARLGITQMSAGSRTEPGGYMHPNAAGEQFQVEDHRSPAEVAKALKAQGYDPVFKDWDSVLNA